LKTIGERDLDRQLRGSSLIGRTTWVNYTAIKEQQEAPTVVFKPFSLGAVGDMSAPRPFQFLIKLIILSVMHPLNLHSTHCTQKIGVYGKNQTSQQPVSHFYQFTRCYGLSVTVRFIRQIKTL